MAKISTLESHFFAFSIILFVF